MGLKKLYNITLTNEQVDRIMKKIVPTSFTDKHAKIDGEIWTTFYKLVEYDCPTGFTITELRKLHTKHTIFQSVSPNDCRIKTCSEENAKVGMIFPFTDNMDNDSNELNLSDKAIIITICSECYNTLIKRIK